MHIEASQLPYKLVAYDWKTNILIKNMNSSQAWTAAEILEFLDVYAKQTENDVGSGCRWIDFSKELAKRKVYCSNKQCRQKVITFAYYKITCRNSYYKLCKTNGSVSK